MPWEITIRRRDGASLGELEQVRERIQSAVPAIEFFDCPSGAEQIAAAAAAGFEFPEIIRANLQSKPATQEAQYETEEISIHFYGFESQPLESFYGEVRGNGNPMPVLKALCESNAWVVVNGANGELVDLSAMEAEGWTDFQAFLERAIGSEDESPD